MILNNRICYNLMGHISLNVKRSCFGIKHFSFLFGGDFVLNDEVIEYMINQHEVRLNQCIAKIEKIESNQAETNVRIDNLCKSIESLTGAIKWIIGLSLTTFLGFFIWFIQNYI